MSFGRLSGYLSEGKLLSQVYGGLMVDKAKCERETATMSKALGRELDNAEL